MGSYLMKCRNPKCGIEFRRYWKREEFDRLQYDSCGSGISCQKCGYPRCIVTKSKRSVDDGFKPGFQRNIMKHCATYSEYKDHLKNMGLIELGYDELPEKEPEQTNYFDDEIMKLLYEKHGVNLDSREVLHLQGKI